MSPGGLPDVSVVIPVRDVEATIGSQLQALAGQTYDGEWELIIVDNGSSDGTQAVIEREGAAIPNLRVIDARDVDGVSAVRNQGIAVARGRLIVFCDGDDIVDAEWIQAMSRALDRSDAVAGAIRTDRINPPNLVEWRAQGLRDALNIWAGFLPWGISANFGAHAEALRAVGGFDDAIPGNCAEDVDLCWRLQLAGFTLSFAPLAIVDYRLRDDLRGSLNRPIGMPATRPSCTAAIGRWGCPGDPSMWS